MSGGGVDGWWWVEVLLWPSWSIISQHRSSYLLLDGRGKLLLTRGEFDTASVNSYGGY